MLAIIIRSAFEEDGKHYPLFFLDDFVYEVLMLEHDMTDVSERSDINKKNTSKECDICQCWYFKDNGFKYEPHLYNSYHDLMQKAANDVAIVSVNSSDYRIHFWHMSKNDAISIMKNSNLNQKKLIIIIFLLYIKIE